MLIGLVRDSVRQCFCHSCKAPLGIVGESLIRHFFHLSGKKDATVFRIFSLFSPFYYLSRVSVVARVRAMRIIRRQGVDTAVNDSCDRGDPLNS